MKQVLLYQDVNEVVEPEKRNGITYYRKPEKLGRIQKPIFVYETPTQNYTVTELGKSRLELKSERKLKTVSRQALLENAAAQQTVKILQKYKKQTKENFKKIFANVIYNLEYANKPHVLNMIGGSPFVSFAGGGVPENWYDEDWKARKQITVNGNAEVPKIVDDDFTSYADQTAFDNTYLTTDTAKLRGNPTNDNIDYNLPVSSTYNVALSRDLTSTSDTNWIMRFKLNHTTINTTGAGQTRFWIGLSSTDKDTLSTTLQDFIGLRMAAINTGATYQIVDTDGVAISGAATDATFTRALQVETVYVDMRRTSTTSYTISLYSDSAYTTLLERKTGTCVSTTNTLRYWKMLARDNDGTVTSIVGTVDDLKIWNGVSAITEIPNTELALNTYSSLTDGGGWTIISNVDKKGGVQVQSTFAGIGKTIKNVKIYVYKSASPTGNAPLRILSDNDTVKATSTVSLDVSTLGTSSTGTEVNFTLDNPVVLAVGDRIILDGTSVTASATNLVLLTDQNTTPVTGTQETYYTTVWAQNNRKPKMVFDYIGGDVDTTLTNFPFTVKRTGDTDLQRRVSATVTDNLATDKGWVDDGSGDYVYANSPDRLDFNAIKRSTTAQFLYIDLQDADYLNGQNISDTAFRVRFGKFHITSLDGASNVFLLFGFSSTTGDSGTAQDSAKIAINFNTSAATFGLYTTDNANLESGATKTNSTVVTPTAGNDYYFEMIRTGAASFKLNIFSDSNYTTLLDSVTSSNGTSISGLRYLKCINDSESTAGSAADAQLEGAIEIWNGSGVEQETPTFQDDFASDSWSDTGSNFGVSGGVNTWKFKRELAVHGTSKDLGFDLNTSFCVDFKLTCDNFTQATANGTYMWWLLQDTNVVNSETSRSSLGLAGINVTGGNYCWLAQNVAGDPDNDSLPQISGTTDFLSASKVYYVRFSRNGSTFTVSLFTDSARTQLAFPSQSEAVSVTATLRYFVMHTWNLATGTWNGVIDGSIDDFKVWNGVSTPDATANRFVFTTSDGQTETASEIEKYDAFEGDLISHVRAPSLPNNTTTDFFMYYDYQPASSPSWIPAAMPVGTTETFRDDFSGADNWLDNGSNINVNTSTDVIDFNSGTSLTNHSTSYDLGITSDISWTLRWKHRFTTVNDAHGALMYIGLSDGNASVASGTNQDSILCMLNNHTGDEGNNYATADTDGATNPVKDTAQNITWATSTDYFFELSRTSSTTFIVRRFTDSTYSVIADSVTGTCTVTNLNHRYIKVYCNSQIDNTSGFIGTLDDVSFWNGKKTAPTRAQSVWDQNYRSVFHMKSATAITDSTTTAITGTPANLTQTVGQLGEGNLFNNTSSSVTAIGAVSDFNYLHQTSPKFTVEFWYKSTNAPSADEQIFDNNNHVNTKIGTVIVAQANRAMRYLIRTGGGASSDVLDLTAANNFVPDNNFNYYSMRYSHTDSNPQGRLRINTINEQTANKGGTSPSGSNATHQMAFGRRPSDADQYLDGSLDELRFSNIDRTNSWLISSYNSQKNSSTFLTIAAEESI